MIKITQASGRRNARRLVAVAGAAFIVGGLVTAAAPAYADTAKDAVCTDTTQGVSATPIDAGTDGPQADTITATGTVTCVDANNQPLAGGTSQVTANLPGVQCTGDENAGTVNEQITWSDGTTTTIDFSQLDAAESSGTANITSTGTATGTRFANDTVTATGSASGSGCGTSSGLSNDTGTMTLTFTPAAA
jgi:hypothetical protein